MESEKRKVVALTETLTWETIAGKRKARHCIERGKWRKRAEMRGKKEKRGKR